MNRTRSNSPDLRENLSAIALGLLFGPLAGAVAWAIYVLLFGLSA